MMNAATTISANGNNTPTVTQRRAGRRRPLELKHDNHSCSPSTPRHSASSESSGDTMSLEEEPETTFTQAFTSPTSTRAVVVALACTTTTLSPSSCKRRMSSASSSSANSPCSSSSSSSGGGKTSSISARKGVQYGHDGSVVCCRFCEILRTGDAQFVYQDHDLVVFRPLSPVVESHVLVVPRCHIRNINMLTHHHVALLKRMQQVAEFVLRKDGDASPSSLNHRTTTTTTTAIECKFAFHKPPFNSIDHVHMHAFRKSQGGSFGSFGSIKYRTETWWCRSLADVLARVDANANVNANNTDPLHSATSSESGMPPSPQLL